MSSGVTQTLGAPPVDPALVSVYPMVRVEIRESETGALEGLVDDQLVASDVEFEPVRAAVISASARLAGRRQGPVQAVRVRAVTAGSVFHLVVTAGGEVFETADPARVSVARSRWPRRRWLYVAGGAAVALLMLAAAVFGVVGSGSGRRPVAGAVTPPAPSPTPTQLPAAVPAPYGPVARWAVPLGTLTAASGGQRIAADDARVYAVVGTDHVAAFAADTGHQAWSRALDGTVQGGPALTRVVGGQVLTAATSDRLYLLAPTSGAVLRSWPIPVSGSAVQVTATGPVVTVDSQHVLVVDRGGLVGRVLPAAGEPVAPTTSAGLVVVGGSGQVWTVRTPQVAGAASTLAAPAGTSFYGPVGWTGSQLVVAFVKAGAATAASQVQLRSYAAGSWQPRWTTGWVPAATAAAALTAGLAASPAGGWGIYGTTAVDLDTGTTAALPSDWQTTAVGDRVAFGTGAGRALAATVAGVTAVSMAAPLASTAPGAASPQLVAPQAVSGDAAYLVANDGSGDVLYALSLPPGTPGTTSALAVGSTSSTSSAAAAPPTPDGSGPAR